VLSLALLFFSQTSYSAQDGPYFPSHRFPTDRSFHIGYQFGYLKSSGNFDDLGEKVALASGSSITRTRHTVSPEYQPSRQFNFGAFLNFDGVKLSDEAGVSTSKNSFSDQVLWGEYRFFDIPGASVGIASVVKFPLYGNPTVQDLPTSATTNNSVVLLGDAQTDISILSTAELWPNDTFRIRANFGYTYRSDSYAAELPYLFSLGFVTQKVDFSLNVKGNFSLGNDSLAVSDPSAAANAQAVKNAFGGSNYALSENPSLSVLALKGELWFDPRWGVQSEFNFPIKGTNAIHFWNLAFGIVYRWAETDQVRKRTAREVDITVDQEKGQFEGESEDEFF